MVRKEGRSSDRSSAHSGDSTASSNSRASMPRLRHLKPQPAVNGAITYERWRFKYVREYRGGLYVAYNAKHTMDPAEAVTVSEATGYGLLASVLAGYRADFDGFLTFWRCFQTPSGLMYWQLLREENSEICANLGTLNSATDGDMDIAFALFQAAKVWAEPQYKAQALRVCSALLSQCYNEDTKVLLLGDWCIPGHELHGVARSSDFLLSHLTMFAAEDAAHADIWASCLEATLQALEAQFVQNPTGLMADFVAYNATTARYEPVLGKVLERADDPHYCFNSCRIPWRLAVYYAETGNERVLPILSALTTFFEAQQEIYAGYTLEGRRLVHYSHLSFSAPVVCLFKVMHSPHLVRMTGLMHKMGEGSYFGDTIQLLCDMQTAHLPDN